MIVELNEIEFDCHLDVEYYREGAQDLIRKLVPSDLLQVDEEQRPCAKRTFQDLLPIFSCSDLSRAPCSISLLLLSKYRQNGSQFFYEMIRHWLLPHKTLNVDLFFTADIRLPDLSADLLNVSEIVVQIKSVHELEGVKKNLQQIETEIRLGIASHYHARRILEFKGLSNDGKTAMIQEKIGSLIQNRSKDFDREIFSQMQQFLVSCSDDFKKVRDYHHISRIISNLHSLRKFLKQTASPISSKRQILLKFLKTKLTGSNRSVLGILAGITLSKDQERFEMTHFADALKQILLPLRIVENSFFSDSAQEPSFQTNYLEVEKESGDDFTHDEVLLLREKLPNLIKAHIEQLNHPVFMPRNEEEVLRNIMTLSQQLRFVNDLPQLIITFDEQKSQKLNFTVVLLRVLTADSPSLKDHFAYKKPNLEITFERIRRLGVLGRKHTKEASVFRIKIPSSDFLRMDRSVDLYKARQKILSELSRALGDLRDYNGGIISKQNELFSALKKSLGRTSENHAALLEKFFFSLTPVELRATMEIDDLKQLFLLLLHAQKCDLFNECVIKQEKERLFYIHPQICARSKQKMRAVLESLNIPHCRLISFFLDSQETPCAGFLLRSDNAEEQARFLETMQRIK